MKIYVVLILLLSLTVFGQENKDKDLKYSEEDFQKAVQDEFEKRMKKVGRSNLIEFSNELLKKEEALLEKEKLLSKREEQLKLNEKELKNRFAEFNKEQKNFLACLDKEDKKVERRLRHMVDVVSGMKPQTAADLLSQQDPSLAVKIMGELDAVKVAKIFNLMKKEISAKLQKQYMTLKK